VTPAGRTPRDLGLTVDGACGPSPSDVRLELQHGRTVEVTCWDADRVFGTPENRQGSGKTTVSREPEDLDMTGDSTFGATQDGAAPASARTAETPAARSWPRRLVHSLVLLDSWSPASYRLSSLPAARSYVRAEWTRSGDLTDPQATALLALDETTPWQV
jgi:hypothetical protein